MLRDLITCCTAIEKSMFKVNRIWMLFELRASVIRRSGFADFEVPERVRVMACPMAFLPSALALRAVHCLIRRLSDHTCALFWL